MTPTYDQQVVPARVIRRWVSPPQRCAPDHPVIVAALAAAPSFRKDVRAPRSIAGTGTGDGETPRLCRSTWSFSLSGIDSSAVRGTPLREAG